MTEDTFYGKMVDRNIGLIGLEQQKKLKESCVAIFGLGGLGGVAAELLARSGIGTLKISDIDVFEHSNLNRQIFAYASTLGQSKVDVTERFLKDINPELKIEKFGISTEESINQMLNGANVAILCIDKALPSIHVARACREKDIPMVETIAIPFVNLRVYTKKTMTYEEFHELPTAGKSMEELYALDEESVAKIRTQWLMTFYNIEGLAKFFDEEAIKRIKKAGLPLLVPWSG